MFAAALLMAGLVAEDKQVPKPGDKAPEFNLPAVNIGTALSGLKDKKSLTNADVKGKNVVLFFFPRALTKGCTVESCGFRDLADQFSQLDTVVVGISNDKIEKQKEFTEKEKLNFPLLADTDSEVCKAFGVLNTERKAANRLTFVIDKQGVIRKVYPTVKPMGHPEEVLKYVKEHLASEK
jgi:peroxiredoxin Q/BCP